MRLNNIFLSATALGLAAWLRHLLRSLWDVERGVRLFSDSSLLFCVLVIVFLFLRQNIATEDGSEVLRMLLHSAGAARTDGKL
jgi:hypothetical protein